MQSGVNIIVVAIRILNQTCVGSNTIHIVADCTIIVLNQAILNIFVISINDHLVGGFIKLIIALLNIQTVGVANPVTTGNCRVIGRIKVIIIAVHKEQTLLVYTFNQVIQLTIVFPQAGLIKGSNIDTFIGKFIPGRRIVALAEVEPTDTFFTVAIIIKVIGVTVNLCPSTLVRTRTIEVQSTNTIIHPQAIEQFALFVELIGLRINPVVLAIPRQTGVRIEVVIVSVNVLPALGLSANSNVVPAIIFLQEAGVLGLASTHAIFAEVVVIAVDVLNAGQLHAVHIVAIANPSVGYSHTVRINLTVSPLAGVGFLTALMSTLQNIVHKIILMACGRDRGAPVNNRATNLAVGSVGVAAFCAGRILIVKFGYGVDMSTIPIVIIFFALGGRDHVLAHLVHFGIYLRAFAGERIGCSVRKHHDTTVDFHADVNGPEFFHGFELCVGVCGLSALCTAGIGIAHLQFPSADRQGCQNTFTGICVSAGAGNRNGRNVFVILDGVGCGKAVSHFHVIQFPNTHVVQVNIDRYRLNFLNIGSNDVCIPNRAKQNLIQTRIMCNYLNRRESGISLHINGADNGSIVALIIADGELDMMNAVCQSQIRNGHNAIAVIAVNLNTINICLSSVYIQTGIIIFGSIIRNLNSKTDVVGGNGLSVQGFRIGHGRSCVSYISENRCFTVINCVRVVNGDVVHIHHITTIIGLIVGIVVIEVRTVTVRNIKLDNISLMQIKSCIVTQVNRQIVPTRFLKGAYNTSGRGVAIHHRGRNCTRCLDVITFLVQSQRIHRITNPCGNILIGDIDPHTQLGGVFKGFHIAGVLECSHHIAGFQRIAVIDIESQCVVAAMNLTGFTVNQIGASFREDIVVGTVIQCKVTDIAIFKIIDDLRTLTQIDGALCRNLGAHNGSGNRARGHTLIVTGSKFKPIHRADGIIRQFKAQIVCLDLNFIQTVRGSKPNRNSFAEGNGDCGTIECQSIRNNCMNGSVTNFLAFIVSSQSHITLGSCGQYAILISTVGNFISHAIRNLGCTTSGRNAGDADLGRGTGGHILVLGSHGHMIESVGRNRQRGDHQTGRDRTLGAIGRIIDDLNSVRAFLTSSIGSGAAAVQVDGGHAAGLQHDLCQLVHGAAAGERLLTAIQNHKHYLTIFGNTHTGTRMTVSVIITSSRCGNILAVPNQPLRTGNGLPHSGVAIFINIVIGICRIVNHSSTVGQNGKEGIAATGRTEGFTIDNRVTGGLASGHVVERTVDARNYGVVIADVILIFRIGVLFIRIGNLIGQFFHAQAIIVLLLVRSLHDYVITADISGGHIVHHLLAIAGISIVDVLFHTGSQSGLGVLEHSVCLTDKVRAASLDPFHNRKQPLLLCLSQGCKKYVCFFVTKTVDIVQKFTIGHGIHVDRIFGSLYINSFFCFGRIFGSFYIDGFFRFSRIFGFNSGFGHFFRSSRCGFLHIISGFSRIGTDGG